MCKYIIKVLSYSKPIWVVVGDGLKVAKKEGFTHKLRDSATP